MKIEETPKPIVTDKVLTYKPVEQKVLFVDIKGNALIVKQPRPVGFRKP